MGTPPDRTVATDSNAYIVNSGNNTVTGEQDTTKVLDVTKDFGDRFAVVTAWRVPD